MSKYQFLSRFNKSLIYDRKLPFLKLNSMFNVYISLKGQNKISGGRSDPRLTCGYSCHNSNAVILVKKLSLYVFPVKSLNFAHIRYGRGPGQVSWARISVDFY